MGVVDVSLHVCVTKLEVASSSLMHVMQCHKFMSISCNACLLRPRGAKTR